MIVDRWAKALKRTRDKGHGRDCNWDARVCYM